MQDKAIEMSFEPLERLLKAAKKGGNIKIGILGDHNARKNGGSNATIGLKHEFGLDGMPERSFLRMPLGNHLQSFLDKKGLFDEDALKKVIKTGKLTPWMEKVAVAGEDCIAEAFNSNGFGTWASWKGNYRSNSGQILVYSTQLRDSITSEVEES